MDEFTADAGVIKCKPALAGLLLSVPAGILADRFDKRNILIINYFTLFLATLWIAFLLQRESTIFWLLLVVALRSCLMTIEVPVRNSFCQIWFRNQCWQVLYQCRPPLSIWQE